ncbi:MULTISPECIES: acyl-CoA desaturase [Prauserella salsuginis group]|uniref:Stearoyl-CoA desaturase (Delta-9 desaturase) n=2 Tax=Prauserella salsuginis group TaxID=2893672 RepID=A0A839XQC6_9PSEU|nr:MULTISPECIES: acyl-CoA desaturase [Prauserella salsuginis group]MBB3663684.1 stearoyl-CoA desaturase (delta-9 desaturase) [Prauserella sediminis]MCR3722535.1 stearoyl-CoA desaturase (delta-9 desaturase) [Prauserella flava]MCR3736977.1 stearoyl-CoA desaturase (delta-9 desaturase) [Prauserella salsuginis]
MTATLDADETPKAGRKPILDGQRTAGLQFAVYLGVLAPLAALIAAVPFAWGWGLSWVDVGLFVVFYAFSGLGITVGFHRYFTHGSFKAKPWLRALLAIAGSSAVQGPVITWVADHRRHHAFSDREGDPHSPWLFGTTPVAVAKGFWHAHMGWLFQRDQSNHERFAPDLLKDNAISRIDKLFGLWTLLTFVLPGIIGGLVTWSLWGFVTAFFWAGLVRVCVLHHVTWSVNSICHMLGERPFSARDRSANFWPLAIASFGESWHNLHHADPTSARHGVQRGQIDISARVIWVFEKLGWAHKVRWPSAKRLEKLSTA